MSLTSSWGRTAAYRNPIVLDHSHPLYNEIYPIRRDSSWYRNTDTGEIEIQQPILTDFAFLTMVMGLGSITEKNVDEWWFRLHFAVQTGYNKHCLTKNVWTDTGWKQEPLTLDDLRSLIGLSTNADKMTRKGWFRHACSCLERDVEYSLR